VKIHDIVFHFTYNRWALFWVCAWIILILITEQQMLDIVACEISVSVSSLIYAHLCFMLSLTHFSKTLIKIKITPSWEQ
jgi:hypothetical protein